MNYSPSSRDAIDEHCREVIRSCLNIVEQHGDTYVAIHKDDDIECIVLVSMIRSYPILSIIVADKLLLADKLFGLARLNDVLPNGFLLNVLSGKNNCQKGAVGAVNGYHTVRG